MGKLVDYSDNNELVQLSTIKDYLARKEEVTTGKLVKLYKRRNQLDIDIFNVKQELQSIWEAQKQLDAKDKDVMDR